MKRIINTYILTLNDGRQLATRGQGNQVEAFDQLHMLFPIETEGYTFRDLTVRYSGKTNM